MKKFLLFLTLAFVSYTSVNAADFEKINAIDNWNIEILTSSDIVLPEWTVDTDLKILKDYFVSFAYKDPQDSKKILLNLTYDLEKNKNYTIIGVDGAEVNINFSIGDSITWEFINKDKKETELNIEKIVISDPKTIEIYYSKDLTAEEFIFKVLSEIPVEQKVSNWINSLNVTLKEPLENLTSYIVLSEYIVDALGKKDQLKEKFYDFETKDNLANVFKEVENFSGNLDSASTNSGNLEEVAQNAKHVPQTWTSTLVIILMAILLAGFSISIFRKQA